MFNKILVANRGAVAARVLRACRKLGIRTAVVYSEADRDLPYLAAADERHEIGPAPAAESYLHQDRLLDVLRRSGADALHPGYGFLSENAAFAEKVEAAGATFIGPSPKWLAAMGHKTRARELMASHGLPMGASSRLLGADMAANLKEAERVGYPVLIKPAGGGGGIGMIAAHSPADLPKALEGARSLSSRSFGSVDIYLERLVQRPRHIEFQILADRYGHVRHLFERDCSVQRRHQKVVEEACAPNIPRAMLDAAAERIAAVLGSLRYDVIGTVETLYDTQTGEFNFLEVNTRLQVEHAVTEEVTGIDLVTSQIRLAAGERLSEVLPDTLEIQGHAVQARIYAEDPVRFYPSPGLLELLEFPSAEGVRLETGYATGCRVTPHYDPMIAKIIARGRNRDEAIARLDAALEGSRIRGVKTNIPFIRQVLASEQFRSGAVHTDIAADVLREAANRTAAVAS
ncbi:Biotin carboxylase [Variovorax sp. SRS16]|uniref:acetyl-CoA carboxylase biotin carboxylase subunit n=1 Tax=Variovorax sp. SRS16 TaxID=282217 RepID=UPI0013161B56|nr:biotin carboxylase N-terminal domain-containing protein [Variovorax sp. SRS16]VTU14393.1 Biotin carboxylase [Variovorax sp. SRS16]